MSKRKIMVWLASLLVIALLAAWVNPVGVSRASNVISTDLANYQQTETSTAQIMLNGNAISVEGNGVTVDGSTATIIAAGTYSISGSLTDGQIVVAAGDEDVVQLVLNGASISSSTSAPLYVENAAEVMLTLADNTENYVSDGSTYVLASADTDEPNAAIFSSSDLTIAGNGTLTVAGNYNDGIASKDGLTITSGTINVNAVDDGLRGKDYIVVNAGTITVNAQGNGLKSDDADDATLGYITVQSCTLTVKVGGDALSAETNVLITDGIFNLTAGGGSGSYVASDVSAQGIKAAVSIQLDGGVFTIDTADDALNANDSVVINGGSYLIASGDDGIHADATLDVNGGDINITRSYEGIESAVITINAGTIHLIASDDGVNVAGGNDSSGMMPGGPGQDSFAADNGQYLYINGGYVAVDAGGDGVDVNGSVVMTGGTVLVNGPTENMNGALDVDGGFTVSGGLLVATGSSGMAEAPDQSSTQASLLVNFDAMQAAGTLVSIQTSDGQEIVTFAPTKAYQSIVVSSPDLLTGTTLNVYLGGTSSGTVQDSLYQNGSYTPGTQYTSLTLSGTVTSVGQTGGFGQPRP